MLLTIKDTPKNISGIYKINYPDGRIYIGQAMDIRSRLIEHNQRAFCLGPRKKQKCDQELYNQNYHIEEYELLEEIKDYDLLDKAEKKWIRYFNATNPLLGLNVLEGGNVSGKRGIDNPNSKFTQEQVNEIYDLLINHLELSYIDIANKYNVSQITIFHINAGDRYYNPKLSYPLRDNKVKVFAQKNNLEDYDVQVDDIINLKEDLKYRWDLTLEEDLKNKYQYLPLRIIRDINQGRKFAEIGEYTYPIRNKNVRNVHKFSQEDILNILHDLRYTKMSQIDIGKKYKINRCTVAKINCGQTYIIKNYDYPARK